MGNESFVKRSLNKSFRDEGEPGCFRNFENHLNDNNFQLSLRNIYLFTCLEKKEFVESGD